MTDWHGWGILHTDTALHIGHLPGRKQAALYVVDGSVSTMLAFFPDDEKAQRAIAILDHLLDVADEEDQ